MASRRGPPNVAHAKKVDGSVAASMGWNSGQILNHEAAAAASWPPYAAPLGMPPMGSFSIPPALPAQGMPAIPNASVISSMQDRSAVAPFATLPRFATALTPASMQQPMLLGAFSYDDQKNLCFDNRAKRHYHDPPVHADLNYGFEHFQDKPHIPDPLDSVLYTMMHRASAPYDDLGETVVGASYVPADRVEMELLRTNVVTWRGILTKLCTAWSCHVQAPPTFREGFELNIMMVRSSLLGLTQLGDTLIIEETPPTVYEIAAMHHAPPKPKRQQKATYYGTQYMGHGLTKPGYSFEAYCTARGAEPAPVSTNEQWCHIVKTKLGSNRLVVGGEVDCVESLGEKESVVELKTNMQLRDEQDQARLDVKMLRMYMQSFLLGVRSIVIGFRDAQGMLLSHRAYRTAELPRLVRGRPSQWSANDNLAFGAHILDFVRREIGAVMERWCLQVSESLRQSEVYRGPYAWRVHRTTSSFLGHLPLPSVVDAEQEYPVFRLSFQPPFDQLTLRAVPPAELALDGRRAYRCGLVPTAFYEWATRPL